MFRRQLAVAVSLLATQCTFAEEVLPAISLAPVPPFGKVDEVPTPHTVSNESTHPSGCPRCKAGTCGKKQTLLQQKLAEVERLQREIAKLSAEVPDNEHILLKIQVLELNVTELRRNGVDLGLSGLNTTEINESISLRPTPARTPASQQVQLKATPAANLEKVLVSLKQKPGIVKVLAQPTLVTTAGRPTKFHSGGEIPVPNPSDAKTPIGFANFGTEVDILANPLAGDKLRMNLGVRISTLLPDPNGESGTLTLPRFNVRHLRTEIESSFGEAVMLSGLTEKRKAACKIREGEEVIQDVEYSTLFIVTPERVAPLTAGDPPTPAARLYTR